ncbi:hypothetical protein HNR30_003016 [Nonomuraea soli]|uniref:Uncharacterized protein n=1 Tax=Nonomuraea soli TaxID=1032476 RepID=A0A7W0CIA5_9ACTN|nr:hypothetical protein [Nonomuraea soli]
MPYTLKKAGTPTSFEGTGLLLCQKANSRPATRTRPAGS